MSSNFMWLRFVFHVAKIGYLIDKIHFSPLKERKVDYYWDSQFIEYIPQPFDKLQVAVPIIYNNSDEQIG